MSHRAPRYADVTSLLELKDLLRAITLAVTCPLSDYVVEINKHFCLLCRQPETADLKFKRYKIFPKASKLSLGVSGSGRVCRCGTKWGWEQSPWERLQLVAQEEK